MKEHGQERKDGVEEVEIRGKIQNHMDGIAATPFSCSLSFLALDVRGLEEFGSKIDKNWSKTKMGRETQEAASVEIRTNSRDAGLLCPMLQ